MNVAALVALDGLVFLGGCNRREDITVQPPQQTSEQPAAQVAADQPQYDAVQEAPPPLQVEVQPLPPTPSSVWVAGYWNWDSQRYSWQAGRYAVPPRSGAVWVAPRYDTDSHGARYSRGQWSTRSPGNDRDHK
jgi:hypothetical protein